MECIFGILKGRFRCLKLPILYQSKDAIDNMVFTCCVIHNMLLSHDGLDMRWERDANWGGQGGLHDEDDLDVFHRHLIRVRGATDFAIAGINQLNRRGNLDYLAGEEEVESTHSRLKAKLIAHFVYEYNDNNVEWLQ